MTVIDARFVPVPARGVLSDVLDGERLLWRDGRMIALDRVGAVVWPGLDGARPIASIAGDLAETFGARRSEVEADLVGLCSALVDEGFLESPDPVAPPARQIPHVGEVEDLRFGSGPIPSDGSRLEQATWTYSTGRFLALAHDFMLRTNDRWLGAYVDRRLAAMSAPGPAQRRYSILDTRVPGPARFTTYLDGAGITATSGRDLAVRHLLWHINQQAIQHDTTHLLIHSAAASTPSGEVVALPGSMNAGKSTLVAALVRAGFSYVTDEVVALDIESGIIDPYPRPVNLGRGSWGLLPDLRPDDVDPRSPVPRDLWHVDPRRIGALAPRAPLRFVVAPRYERAAAAALLTEVTRAEAAEILYHHAFNRWERGAAGYRAVVSAVRGAQGARLTSGDVAAAVQAVQRFCAR